MGITISEQLRSAGNSELGPTMLLVRHGQIKANKTGHWHGSTDEPLTFKGRRQARKTSRYLEQSQQRIDRVVTSPLRRCQQTASISVKHLDKTIEIDEGLAEMNLGDWERMAFSDLHTEHDLFTKLTTDTKFRPPAGESVAEVSARMLKALNTISLNAEPDEVILVVSHGVAMGIALATLLNANPTQWRDYQMGNCAISEFGLMPEPSLYNFNQVAHL